MSERAGTQRIIERTLSLGINVDDAKDLPRVGRYLAQFLTTVDHPHGPFDVNLALSVGGGGMPFTVTVINAEDDESDEEEDEENRASN